MISSVEGRCHTSAMTNDHNRSSDRHRAELTLPASSLRKLGIEDHEKDLRRQVDTTLALDSSFASGDPLEVVNGDKLGVKRQS